MENVPTATSDLSTGTDLRPGVGRAAKPLPIGVFPDPLIIPPQRLPHQQTIILLHGRGSSAQIFAPPLLATSSACASAAGDTSFPSLQAAFPHARFVFPTAPRLRATLYRRSIINQWYDGSGDWEETVLGEARPTVEFLHRLLREEIALLRGDSSRIVLGGLSQGCAMALVTLLLWEGEPLGALVGLCGMLPLCGAAEQVLDSECQRGNTNTEGGHGEQDWDVIFSTEDDTEEHMNDCSLTARARTLTSPLREALDLYRNEVEMPPLTHEPDPSFLSPPIFLAHGTEDDNVLLRYGQDASRALRKMGFLVDWREHGGLGHWYSSEMLSQLIGFLKDRFAAADRSSGQTRES